MKVYYQEEEEATQTRDQQKWQKLLLTKAANKDNNAMFSNHEWSS